MDPKEKEALEAYKAEGVELEPEAESEEVDLLGVDSDPATEAVDPPAEEAPSEEDEEEEPTKNEEEEEEELPAEPTPKKRSIYKDYKETKKDLKSERELREDAEKRADELQRQIDEGTKPPAESDNVDLESFAKEIDADPATLEKMKKLFLKDLPKSEMPEGMAEKLEEFEDWQKSNSEAMEKVQFEDEFDAAQDTLKEMFPKATADETKAIKTKLQELAHTEAYHDKELDYIAFKNKTVLTALVSPKKRGLESKAKGDAPETENFTFDPNADLTKLSGPELEAWEKQYEQATASDGLSKDSQGNSIII